MPRWSAQETKEIQFVRSKLHEQISNSPQFPEVVGDRKIIRFLRGHDHDLNKVCDLMSKFLTWRKVANVDQIRTRIVEEGIDHPLKFPKGELILTLIPQLVIAPDALDCMGAPICVEQYNFSPSDVLSKISLAEYIEFMTYSLEYKSLIVEQFSEERELAYLNSLSAEDRAKVGTPDCKLPPYGVIANTCVIRDLAAVGFEHLSSRGLEIIKAVVKIASDNYPELMRKCYMINTPWIFDTAWYFVKGLLAARTIAKVSVMGTNYKSAIASEIPLECLPASLGGTYTGYENYVSFPFNRKFLVPGYVENTKSNEPVASSTDGIQVDVDVEKITEQVNNMETSGNPTMEETVTADGK